MSQQNFITRVKSLTPRRWIGMIVGNLILAIGISILKWSNTGNDPYSGMVMALADMFDTRYGTMLIILNCFIFAIEIVWGRKYVGPGTIVNWFLLGPVVDTFYPFVYRTFGPPSTWWMQLMLSVLGVIVISLACSVYQTSDAGISPYDSMAVIGDDRTRIPYFWCRMFCDGICALVCFLAGGVVGLGMLFCAFGLGPVIAFFNKYFSEPILLGRQALADKKSLEKKG